MKITQTHKAKSIWQVIMAVAAICFVLSQIRDLTPLKIVLGCMILITAIHQVIRAFKDYREIWEVTKQGDRYSIYRNRVPLYSGPVTALLAVTEESKHYMIFPVKSRYIKFPKLEDGGYMARFHQEYREKMRPNKAAHPTHYTPSSLVL